MYAPAKRSQERPRPRVTRFGIHHHLDPPDLQGLNTLNEVLHRLLRVWSSSFRPVPCPTSAVFRVPSFFRRPASRVAARGGFVFSVCRDRKLEGRRVMSSRSFLVGRLVCGRWLLLFSGLR